MISCTYKQHQVCGYAFQYETTGKWGLVSTEGKLLTTDVFAYQPTSVVNGMFAVPDKEGKYKYIWPIHGTIQHPKSIMLGLDHYCGSIGKINDYIKGKYK